MFLKRTVIFAGSLTLLAACTSTQNHTPVAGNGQTESIFDNRAPAADSAAVGGLTQFQQLVLMAKNGTNAKISDVTGSYMGTCYAVDGQNDPEESILTSITSGLDLGGDEGPTAGSDDSPLSPTAAAPSSPIPDDSPLAPVASSAAPGQIVALDVVSLVTLRKDREDHRAAREARHEARREERRQQQADGTAPSDDDGFGGRRHGGGWHRHGRAWGRHGGCHMRKADGSFGIDYNCLSQRAQSLIQEDYKGGRYTQLTDTTTVTQAYDIEPNGNPDFATEARMVTKGDKTYLLVTKTNVYYPGQGLILPIFKNTPDHHIHVVGGQTFQACWFRNTKVAN